MKNIFIYVFVLLIAMSGAMAFWVLYGGKLAGLQLKMIFSASTVALYSIYFICCNAVLEKKYAIVGKSGLVVTFAGLFVVLFTMWATPDNVFLVQLGYVLSSIAFACGHCSLMLLVKPYNLVISVMRSIAICSSISASLFCIYLQITGLRVANTVAEFCYGALIVLVVASTIAPLLSIAAKEED